MRCSPPQLNIFSESYDHWASSEPSRRGNNFSSLQHHSDKQHREKKTNVGDPNHSKRFQIENLWILCYCRYEYLEQHLHASRSSTSRLDPHKAKCLSLVSPKEDPSIEWVVVHYHKDVPLPFCWAHTRPTKSIWINSHGRSIITSVRGGWEVATFLSCLYRAHTKSFWYFNLGNPRTKPSPLKHDNKSKLKWPSLLYHFQSFTETPATKQREDPTHWKKSALKIWPSEMIMHIRSTWESKTREAPVLKQTQNPHQEDTERRLKPKNMTRATRLRVHVKVGMPTRCWSSWAPVRPGTHDLYF
jgi:hypothetical protein